MGTTSLLMSSTPSKREKQLDHLEREFQKARLEVDEKRCLVERKQQLFTRMLEEEYAMAASFLQQQEIDSSCEWESLHRCIEEYDLEARDAAQVAIKQIDTEEENLWQSYRKERWQLEEEITQDKVS
ncbi:MAG: type III secretion protein [Streptococcus parasanguinis]|nr:type III secretion protein [Streptococcus parasanguinis]MDU5561805.1 type III secretion protein [Streptococcus parasanguinis]